MAGRTLSKEEIWRAMELPRSTYYDQLEKGTLITADNLRRAAANLGINRAELLTRYRLIDPLEVTSLAEEIGGPTPLPEPASRTGVITTPARTKSEEHANVSRLQLRDDAVRGISRTTSAMTATSSPRPRSSTTRLATLRRRQDARRVQTVCGAAGDAVHPGASGRLLAGQRRTDLPGRLLRHAYRLLAEHVFGWCCVAPSSTCWDTASARYWCCAETSDRGASRTRTWSLRAGSSPASSGSPPHSSVRCRE